MADGFGRIQGFAAANPYNDIAVNRCLRCGDNTLHLLNRTFSPEFLLNERNRMLLKTTGNLFSIQRANKRINDSINPFRPKL
ncbi:hypothetical protein D3C86_1753040 [compost metagenome]